MGEEWILLDFWPSMFGSRVRIALAEQGISYEYREEDLPGKSSLLLEMNPIHQKIPVLIHNGKPICESLNIDEVCDYAPFLLPSNPYEKARARFWAEFVDNNVISLSFSLFNTCSRDEDNMVQDYRRVGGGKKELIDNLKVLEEQLGEKPYFGGQRFGYLDVVIGGYCSWFFVYEMSGNISIEAECPKLMAWTNKCMKRESFSKSLRAPQRIYDFLI